MREGEIKMNESQVPAREREIGYDPEADAQDFMNEIWHATRRDPDDDLTVDELAAKHDDEMFGPQDADLDLDDDAFYSTPSRVTPEQEREAHAALAALLPSQDPDQAADIRDDTPDADAYFAGSDIDDEPYSPYSDVDGYDRNGAFDGFGVVSDADPGL